MPAQDKFANLANLDVTESGANTLTFNQLTSGAGIFEKMAMIIHRIEYVVTGSLLGTIIASDDQFEFAWVTSDQISGLAKDKAQVVDALRLVYKKEGTTANYTLHEMPVTHNFADLPGGGVIVPATQLYLAIQGTSVASPGYVRSSMYFSYRELKPEEYWELVEATRALS